jgi:fatty-acid desaturase
MLDSLPAAAVQPTQAARHIPRPPSVTNRVVWRYTLPIVTVHLLALAALVPWLFSWTGVILLVAGIYVYGPLGINIAYHRLLTHRSFKCPLWWEHVMVTIAICCLEDAPGSWVATHRLHHNDSDETLDPHTPRAGFFWSHMGWLLIENRNIRTASAYERFARDVLRDPYYMRLQRTLLQLWIYALHAAVYFIAGMVASWLAGGDWLARLQFGLSLLVWGVLVRTVCVWHITWSVNSVAHVIGYRTYDTGEGSRNSWPVALFTAEGWHNNHHIDPASASNWHRWWEIDLIYVLICAMERVGLASDVIRPRCLRKQ